MAQYKTVINWFKNVSHKHKRKFIKFDIAEFNPSISETFLNKSIAHAKSFTKIEDNAIKAIKLARKSLRLTKTGLGSRKETIHYLT